MTYLLVPDLIAILWMAVVLSHLRTRRPTDFLHLWTVGLGLVVIEGVARILYMLPLTRSAHLAAHVVALDGYLLAGVAFYQSATGKLRSLPNSTRFLALCLAPALALLTLYGAGLSSRALFTGVAVLGLVAGSLGSLLVRRPFLHLFLNAVVWLPVLAAVLAGENRGATYLLLFDVYAATAIAFSLTLPRERWGRAVVIAGFFMWSLCFLTHPWIALHHPEWGAMAGKIWDLQKFVVTFGLLIVTLEEDNAAKEYDALHDTLTGLPNRRLFRDRLEQAVAQSRRKGSRVLVFNIDLDNFKEVNDRWGHDAGDALLVEIGRRLGAVTRRADTLARMGGDEFQLLILDFLPSLGGSPASRQQEVQARGEQLMEAFRDAVERSTFLLPVGDGSARAQPLLSIGAAIFPDQADSLDALCRLADQNMYADKRRRAARANGVPAHRNGLHLASQSAS